MPYIPPATFVSNTDMVAETFDLNNTALRTYLNVGIVQADIGTSSVNTADIVKGEYVSVTTDHQFTSGDMYVQFNDLQQVGDKIFTAHIQSSNLVSFTAPYSQLPSSGKRIILEKPADVLYSVGLLGWGDANYQMQPHGRRNPCIMAHATGDVLRGSDIEGSTRGHCYTEDETQYTPIDADNSGNVIDGASVIGLFSRRWYCQRFLFTNLPAGIHHFYMVVNGRCDKGRVAVLNSEIEVFTKGTI